jgi:hypothetical protein
MMSFKESVHARGFRLRGQSCSKYEALAASVSDIEMDAFITGFICADSKGEARRNQQDIGADWQT